MKYLICYDIPETKKRTKVVKYLQEFSYRLQYSVFLGEGDRKEIEQMKMRLKNIVADSPDSRIIIIPLTEENLRTWWLYGTVLEEKSDCVIA